MQKNIIQGQVQSLRKHPHIKKIQKIHNRLLQILYYPKDVKSFYAEFEYRLKIQLPIDYPEHPPTVKFIDPITHINVNSKTGEVAMPLLLDEWSPYISLYIIVDLLDNILLEPQLSEKYCVGQKPSRFRDKQNESTLLRKPQEIPIFKTHEQEEISMIKKISINQRKHQIEEEELKPIGTMKKKLKRLKTIILQKSQRVDAQEEKPHSPNHIRFLSEVDKIQQQQSFILNEKQEVKRPKASKDAKNSPLFQNLLIISKPIEQNNNSLKIDEYDEIREQKEDSSKVLRSHIVKKENQKLDGKSQKKEHQLICLHKNEQTVRKKVQDLQKKSLKVLSSTIFFEKTTNSLVKINKLIELFTQQLKELQKKKTQSNNQYLTRIVQKKIEQQVNMLEQLEDLSFTVKKSMVSNLKKHLSK